MKDFTRKYWSQLLLILLFISFILLNFDFRKESKNVSKNTITPLEYKKLNDECNEYGEDKFGQYSEYTSGILTTRKYKFSIPLMSCVLSMRTQLTNDNNKDIEIITFRDIYMDREILFYNSDCVNIHIKENLSFEELSKKMSILFRGTKKSK